jgi:type IV pilus assembly protein PilQ
LFIGNLVVFVDLRMKDNSLGNNSAVTSTGNRHTLFIKGIEQRKNSLLALYFALLIITTTVVVNAAQESSDNSSQDTGKKIAAVEETQSFAFAENTQIADALDILAERYKKNIVFPPTIEGQLSCKKLFDVTFDEALEAILGTNFRYEQKDNLVKVYDAQKHSGTKNNRDLMTHKVFTLYYISAAEASELVSSVLSEDGKIKITAASEVGVPVEESISAQTGNNKTAMNDTLVICDYPENIKAVEQVLASIDIEPQQVLIEATILSATLTEGMQFGIDWQTLTTAVDELTDITRGASDYYKSAGTSAKVGSESLSGGLTIGFAHDSVAGFIRAVEDVTDVTILANPKILAVNKQLGQVYIGKKIAYQSQTTQTDTSTTEEVKFLDTGTKLSFRPYICKDGRIRMDIHPKDSSATLRSSGEATLPDETSAELVTNIIVEDGQTIVIGGLFRDVITTAKTQVPILGDLPVIGVVFRGTADEVRHEEVIVLLTPHIITKTHQTARWARVEDIQHKTFGAKEELQWINEMRRAKDYFESAEKQYIKGDYEAEMKELKSAIELYPAFLEARRLKEKIEEELNQKNIKPNH